MFLIGTSEVENLIRNHERNQIYKLVEQRNEAIAMKLLPEQVQGKGDSENEKINNNLDYSSVHSANFLLAHHWDRGIAMDRWSSNTAIHQVKELI